MEEINVTKLLNINFKTIDQYDFIKIDLNDNHVNGAINWSCYPIFL